VISNAHSDAHRLDHKDNNPLCPPDPITSGVNVSGASVIAIQVAADHIAAGGVSGRESCPAASTRLPLLESLYKLPAITHRTGRK